MTPEVTPAAYGYCPDCGAPGKMRERRLNGNDTCERGHVYPSRNALPYPPAGKTAEIQQLIDVIADWTAMHGTQGLEGLFIHAHGNKLVETVNRLAAENRRYREALEHYAKMPVIEMDGTKEDLSLPAKQALSPSHELR